MLQPVPVSFQRFRIVPGDFLRQERDKGERHHRCLSEEARIIEPKFSKRTRGGRLALVIFGANSTTGARIASPLLRAREAEPNCGYVGDRAVRIQEWLEAAALNLVPHPATKHPLRRFAPCLRGIKDEISVQPVCTPIKQPASLAIAPRGLARRRSSRYRRPSPQARRKTPAAAPAESRRRARDTCEASGQR